MVFDGRQAARTPLCNMRDPFTLSCTATMSAISSHGLHGILMVSKSVCQGRSKTLPVGRSKSRPVDKQEVEGFAGSVARLSLSWA